ncbi:MAG: hypothetical protein JW787_00205 [Sedimentisphaerales bacterium]|nr:hypothetical protein [Sedimentisphaerales bacterium]
MNKILKSQPVVNILLYLFVLVIISLSSGCSACFKALAREMIDDGKHAKIKSQSFAEHFKDAMLEDLSGIQPVINKSKR